MRTSILSFLSIALAVFVSTPALAGDGVREERVHFKSGTSGATVKGRIQGREGVDYLLGAKAGQRMNVSLATDNPRANFNILPPGSGQALFAGGGSGNSFEGTLPASGDYRVQVYLVRAAARRNESAHYSVKMHIGGSGHQQSHSAPAVDYADGDAGGPDFWQVTGVAADDKLNMRRGPSTHEAVVTSFRNGTALRNLGCKSQGGQRWCEVSLREDPGLRGWVAGRYLREASD